MIDKPARHITITLTPLQDSAKASHAYRQSLVVDNSDGKLEAIVSDKPAWMETWTVPHGIVGDRYLMIDRNEPGATCAPTLTFEAHAIRSAELKAIEMLPEWGRLLAAAPAMARALLLSEFVGTDGVCGDSVCGDCRPGGDALNPVHEAGCLIDAALTAAGFTDRASRDGARRLISASRCAGHVWRGSDGRCVRCGSDRETAERAKGQRR